MGQNGWAAILLAAIPAVAVGFAAWRMAVIFRRGERELAVAGDHPRVIATLLTACNRAATLRLRQRPRSPPPQAPLPWSGA
jgi:hypothetical protein